MLVSGINTWPPTGSAGPPATASIAQAVVRAIDNGGKRKMCDFIVCPISLSVYNARRNRAMF